MSGLFASPVFIGLVDSTNRFVADEARRGAAEGLVVVADHQTAGRGRKGRPWFSEPGASLLCSLLFRPTFSIEQAHLIPTVVALAARDAIDELIGLAPDCKWPNDLLIGNKKVAGILSELVSGSPRPEPSPTARGDLRSDGYGVVCGIGINLAPPIAPEGSDPEIAELLARATSLAEATGRPIDRDRLLRRLLELVASDYAQLHEPGHADEVMARYRRACATIGAVVEVQTDVEHFEAVALDIDDSGRLVVEQGGSRRTLEAAEVVHLRRSGGSY